MVRKRKWFEGPKGATEKSGKERKEEILDAKTTSEMTGHSVSSQRRNFRG